MATTYISDDVRAALSQQSPEIRRGVLAVADADKRGRSITPAAHDPDRPRPKSRPHEPYQPKPFKPVRIKQIVDMPAPRSAGPRSGSGSGPSTMPNPARRPR